MEIRLKEIMKERDISILGLYRVTDISPSTISRIYNQQSKLIAFDTLEKICYALNCTPNDILVVEKPEKTKSSPS